MRTSHILTGVLFLSILSTSCVRKTDVNEPETKPVAGTGGNTVLRVSPRHHLKPIDSCTIYVKYNATSKPSSLVFDDSIKVTPQDGRPMAKFNALKKGDYYFYGVGYDGDLAEVVTGGTPFTIVDSLENSYDIYLAVTEAGH